ncbi:hypothetical protein Nepgr_033662 [Nepenthes gracilis]|uniref:Uncharacterized protein n=1 Tax=Nepenthes gracilis TaxID=150966 RepID=A0AAD3TL14_NEPGR|nr:hypothetical protein Nepgr_033662 [Nepenthes gracilis]
MIRVSILVSESAAAAKYHRRGGLLLQQQSGGRHPTPKGVRASEQTGIRNSSTGNHHTIIGKGYNSTNSSLAFPNLPFTLLPTSRAANLAKPPTETRLHTHLWQSCLTPKQCLRKSSRDQPIHIKAMLPRRHEQAYQNAYQNPHPTFFTQRWDSRPLINGNTNSGTPDRKAHTRQIRGRTRHRTLSGLGRACEKEEEEAGGSRARQPEAEPVTPAPPYLDGEAAEDVAKSTKIEDSLS